MGNSSSKSRRIRELEFNIDCLVDANHKWQAAYKRLEAQNLNLKNVNNFHVGRYNDLDTQTSLKIKGLEDENRRLSDNSSVAVSDSSVHLIIDGENVGIAGVRCYESRVKAMKKKERKAKPNNKPKVTVAVSKKGKKGKKKKNQDTNNQEIFQQVNNNLNKPRKKRNKKGKQQPEMIITTETDSDPQLLTLIENSIDNSSKELQDKIFSYAIVNCISWIKENYPEIKITLVLYQHRYLIENIKELIRTFDSIAIVYSKPKTDDLTILGIAQNCSNGLILSKDKFRDWLKEYPNKYDNVVKNKVIRSFGFSCSIKSTSGLGEHHDQVDLKFHCSNLIVRNDE